MKGLKNQFEYRQTVMVRFEFEKKEVRNEPTESEKDAVKLKGNKKDSNRERWVLKEHRP